MRQRTGTGSFRGEFVFAGGRNDQFAQLSGAALVSGPTTKNGPKCLNPQWVVAKGPREGSLPSRDKSKNWQWMIARQEKAGIEKRCCSDW